VLAAARNGARGARSPSMRAASVSPAARRPPALRGGA